ncbi:cache domain-containing protein [Actinoplanes philippinensis]|uniref:cache domain-containing protein n=1 Tax=Actinoplanes philippinensis TaxID=35752 RepID=UPI0033FD2ACD
MGQTTTVEAAALATDLAEHAFAIADDLRAQAEHLLRTHADLSHLRPAVTAALGGLISGAGVITAERPQRLEWWMGADPAQRTRLDLDLDPASDTFVDVGRQQWFAVPRDTGVRHVTGPYVDYVCAGQYALTFTVPISRDGRFGGIAGADVFVADFERALRPALRALGSPAALVNTHGRVVAGTNAHHLAGSLIRDEQIRAALLTQTPSTVPGGVTLTPCGTLPLTVLTWS